MEIKFRVWDNDKKEMNYNGFDTENRIIVISLTGKLTLIQSDKFEILKTRFEIMQFTGLYDSTKWEELTEGEIEAWTLKGNVPSDWKGKEIYVGDVVKCGYFKDFEIKSKRKWVEVIGEIKCLNLQCISCGGSDFRYLINPKIIGNKFENPNTVKKEIK